jgi:hypothetical protein
MGSLSTREITRRLNLKFGAGMFRCRKCRVGWPNGQPGLPMFEIREGRSWSFVAYADEPHTLGREIRDMRNSGYLLPAGEDGR